MKPAHAVRHFLAVLSLFFHSSHALTACPAPVVQQLEGIRSSWQSAWDAEFARCQRLGNDKVCGHLPGPFRVVAGPASAWLAWRYCNPVVTDGGRCYDGTGYEMACACPPGSSMSPLTNTCAPMPAGGGSEYGGDSSHWEEASCAVGNPTLAGLGIKVHQEGIYASDFASPLPFELRYRSAYSARALLPGGTWLHSYSARLNIGPSDVHALGPDGHVLRFVPGASANTWISSESSDVLKRVAATDPDAVRWELQRQQDDRRETYDNNGKLLVITDRNGWVIRLSYDAAGQLQAMSNPFGRQLRLQYDANGWLAALTSPDASVTHFSFDAQGKLLAITWPDGNVKRYHYEDARFPRALTGITDETGQRIGSYTYDAQGRVIETQRAGGVDRVQFSYGQGANGAPQTTITDFSTGAPSSRTHRFSLQGRVLRPAGASSPCSLCGGTAQSIVYDNAGRKLRELQHDGGVTFYAYDAAGRQTERASFPASFASATTRPALSNASAVTSTEWHPSWNLPIRMAEPGRVSSYTYNPSGLLAVLVTQATSDATGTAGFNAMPTGSLQRTETSYNAQSLPERISEYSDGVLGQQWAMGYNAQGDVTSIVDVTRTRSATITQYTADGRVLQGTTDQGVPIAVAYSLRGAITQITRGTQTARFAYNPVGTLIQARTPDNQVIDYLLDAKQSVVDIKLNGASVSAQMLALGDYPDSNVKGRIEAAKQALIQSVDGLLRAAHAQVVIVGGGSSPAAPIFDPRADMLMSPISAPDNAVRAIQEAIARACRCDPNRGFGAPKFTAVTFAHVFYGGHMIPMFSDKSYFLPTEKVGQALVDEVMAKLGKRRTDGSRDVYNVNMKRVVGMRYDKESASSDKHVPTEWITLVVERNNCSIFWRFNEVVSIYPDEGRK